MIHNLIAERNRTSVPFTFECVFSETSFDILGEVCGVIFRHTVLQLLERDGDEVTRSLANIMKAIEQGIFNETTKTRMDELEQRRNEIDDKIAIEQCKNQNRMTKEKVISYLTDPLRQAPRRLIRALIEKIIVFDDKIQIFFKYTKTSPEVNPWEMPAYPGSDSSDMVELRGFEPLTF